MNPRQLIIKLLTDFDRSPHALDRLIDRSFQDADIDQRDQRFVFEIVYGVIRRMLTLDYLIDRLLDGEVLRKNKPLRIILRVGLYQINFMDKVPEHAAVNESVKLIKNNEETRKFAGVVNGVLRRAIATKRTIPPLDPNAELSERLSIEHSHPRWMIDRWLGSIGLANTKKLLLFNNEKPSVFLRRKIRDVSRPQFEAEVKSLCMPATGFMNLYYKVNKAVVPEQVRVVKQGWCNIQAPSSGWVVSLLDIQKGEHLLDMCSSPGGKTALMSELTGEKGAVCACDNRKARILLTVNTVETMGYTNVYVMVCDAGFLPFAGKFDKVMLDAPCSGTGVLQRHPEARWIKTIDDIIKLAGVQKRLLSSAAQVLNPGGILVYSTCSLEPEENELQIKAFLSEHPEFKLDYCPDVVLQQYIDNFGYLRITPHQHGMDGMFAARLKKMY